MEERDQMHERSTNAVKPLTSDFYEHQRDRERREEEANQRYLAEERERHNQSREDAIRQSALHAALVLDYASKDTDVVLAAAASIEAFLRGEKPAHSSH